MVATEVLGAQLAQIAQPGDVIFLRGELGAGKTSLSRGFLRRFFADPALEVPSPSYLLCFTYGDSAAAPTAPMSDNAPNPVGRAFSGATAGRLPNVNVLHLDPYRLPDGKIASLIDLGPAFERHVCLIEWPERLGDQLVSATHPPRLEITLGGVGPQACGRAASFCAVGDRWTSVLSLWAAAGRVDVALPALPPPPAIAATGSGGGEGSGADQAAHEEAAEVAKALPARCLVPPGAPKDWLVLGIESSCDDTGAAIVRGDGTVLGEVLASQAGVHEAWGGVVPKLAQEAHKGAIDATVEEALRRAGVSAADLTAVAVTVGPGLSLCLEVGVRKALALCAQHSLPLIRCHHMESHAMVTWLPTDASQAPPPPPPRATTGAAMTGGAATTGGSAALVAGAEATTPAAAAAPVAPPTAPPTVPPAAATSAASTLSPDGVPPFPFLTLLVSGGHNMLVLTKGLGSHTILGSTLDDSIGEAFDKTARLLGINQIPGGPPLERMAREGDAKVYSLPMPLSKTRDNALRASCDFSYAGLKSAVRQLLETKLPQHRREVLGPEGTQRELSHVAAAFQRVAVAHLAERTARALNWAREAEPSLTCLVVAGGVAANQTVRSELASVASRAGLPMVCPPVRLCTDNGIMVAWTGMQRLRLGLVEEPLSADASAETIGLFVEVRPRWPLGLRDSRSTTQKQQLSKRKQQLQTQQQQQAAADKRARTEAAAAEKDTEPARLAGS